MHKPKDVPRTTQQWASIICSISNLTPHWLYSSRFIASHRSLLSSHTQRITISIRNYMCDNPNRLPSIITKNGIPTACFSNPPQKKNFRPTRLRVQETWRNAERLPQRSLILQLVVGHRLLLYWLPRLYVQLGLSEFFLRMGCSNCYKIIGDYEVCLTHFSWVSMGIPYKKTPWNSIKPPSHPHFWRTALMIPVIWKRCDCRSQGVGFGTQGGIEETNGREIQIWYNWWGTNLWN
jgi:hypothetical protein